MILYLVRHGQDTPGYRGGWSRFGLTELGKMQAKDFAISFKAQNYHIDYMISSDLPRAKETADIISKFLNIKYGLNPSWREYNNGDLAGMSNQDADKQYPGLFFSDIEMNQSFPNGETPFQYYQRINNALKQVIKLNKDVLIVTHGGVIDVVRHILENKNWTNSSKDKIYYKEAQLVKFVID